MRGNAAGDRQTDRGGVGDDADAVLVHCGEERVEPDGSSKRSFFRLIYVPTFTYGHELRVVTKTPKSGIHWSLGGWAQP